MRKLTASLLLLFALSVYVFAGDPGMPPCKQDCPPPPCTENCGNGLTAVKVVIANIVLAIITK